MSTCDAFLGIDLGGTKILALAARPDGTTLASVAAETPSRESAERVVAVMTETARAVMSQAELDATAVAAVGVASAGAIDAGTGTLVHAPQLPTMSNTPLASMLRQRLGMSAVVGNDANLAALGEHRYGAGRRVQDLVFLAVSTGIGAGIIIGGELFTGSAGFAGEVGHMTIDAHGPYGLSTMPGALESLCSGTALARVATERITAGEYSSMTSVLSNTNRKGLTAREVFAAHHSGDALAQSIITDAVVYLGAGLTNVVNLFNPETIIVGGGLASEWDAYIAPAVALMREQSFAGIGRLTPVVPPALGSEAGALGAIALANDTFRNR
ncbi:MAG: ROK family protein [Gammaproteobacteria bacterium]|nr:ROK family protein [Gammaproteobacteria bacterium]